MKIGIISDLHGNLQALTVILEALKKEQCQSIYSLGDNIAIGPNSPECLNLLFQTPHVQFIMGNHESYFINGITSEMPEGEKRHQQFVADSLNLKHKEKIEAFPYIIQKNFEGIRAAFVHYALTDSKKSFKAIEKNVSAQTLDSLFSNIEADVIFYGHEHILSNVMGHKHYVNVGSSGCTTDDKTHYTIVEFKDKSYEVTTHDVRYDKSKLLKELYDKKIPERDFIAKVFYGIKEN